MSDNKNETRRHVGTTFDGYALNEYGTLVSRHTCGACGNEYTVCPAYPGDDACLARECASYDPSRYLGHEDDEDQAVRFDDGREAALRASEGPKSGQA